VCALKGVRIELEVVCESGQERVERILLDTLDRRTVLLV
jgi:hypothetical protein